MQVKCIQQLNLLMAAMLADSEEVQELLGGTSLLSNSNPSLLNFADNAKLKDDTLVDLSKAGAASADRQRSGKRRMITLRIVIRITGARSHLPSVTKER